MNRHEFYPGDRVEFNSLAFGSRLFRGTVEARLKGGLYSVIHDGETKGRPVNGERLRRCVTFIGRRGGDAA